MPRKKKAEDPRHVDQVDEALALTFSGQPFKALRTVTDLISDRDALESIAEYASSGASIDSIEMKLNLHDGVLKTWLQRGKQDRDGPYRMLYFFYMRASADARIGAEATLLSKNPDKWLEKIEASGQLRIEPVTEISTTFENKNEGYIEVPDDKP